MTRPFLRLVPVLALAVLLCTAPSAAADRLDLEYEVYVGGLLGLTVDANVSLPSATHESYELTARARTVRLLGRLLPYRLDAKSAGFTKQESVTPQRFEYAQNRRGTKETVSLAYRDGAAPERKIVRDDEDKTKESRRRVPDRMAQDTLDPGSAIIAMVRAMAVKGSCAGTVRIFDGKRRYDVTLTPSGVETLEASNYANFSGQATRCVLDLRPLGGFHKSATQRGGFPSSVVIWLAPVVEGAPAIPVRVEASARIGGIRVHLTRARLVSGGGATAG